MPPIPTPLPEFQTLTGIHEPSAIQQLPDGRFLVVEDEKAHPFSLVRIRPNGSIDSNELERGWLDFNAAFWKLDDLEGIAIDGNGFVHAITSHSRDGDGDEKKARDKLVRFRVDGDRITEPTLVQGLKPALSKAHPVLAAAAEIRAVKAEGGLNIEALEISPDQQRLLIGLRSPLLGGRAIIASVDNLAAVFAAGAAPQLAPTLITLDLGGEGVRGMSWLPALAGYLLISGPVAREQIEFKLWFWRGNASDPAQRVTVPGLAGFAHAEGICPAVIEGRQRILIVSDDGSRAENRFARYLLLDPEQLVINP